MGTTFSPELGPAKPKKPLIRRSLLSILLVVVGLAICVPVLAFAFLLRTDYAPGFSKAKFAEVKPGDTLADVLDRLKTPLNFEVVSQRPDGTQSESRLSEEFSRLSDFSNDETILLILRYSKPRTAGGSYRAYELWFNNGHVHKTCAFIYWD